MVAVSGSNPIFDPDFYSSDLVPKFLDLTWELGGTYVTPLSEIDLREMPTVNGAMCNPYKIHGFDGCPLPFTAVALLTHLTQKIS